MIEEWRRVEEFPYEVSNLGRVRRSESSFNYPAGRLLRQHKTKLGYLVVRLNKPGATKYARVHILVCRAFHGPPPTPSHIVAHSDGSRDNNVPSNLRWATHAENSADRAAHDTLCRGERCGTAKLSDAQVRAIRQRYKPFCRLDGAAAIARDYGVSKGTISHIMQGRSWIYTP